MNRTPWLWEAQPKKRRERSLLLERGCGQSVTVARRREGAEAGKPTQGPAQLRGFGGGLRLDFGVEPEIDVQDAADIVANFAMREKSARRGGEVEAGLQHPRREFAAQIVVGQQKPALGIPGAGAFV